MRRLAPLVLTLAVAACSDTVGMSFDERWVGPVTPADPPGCGAPSQATLTRRGDAFTFTPNDGVIVVAGKVAADGQLQGTLTLTGAEHRTFPVTLAGKLTAAGFEGTYATPRCAARVSLHKPPG